MIKKTIILVFVCTLLLGDIYGQTTGINTQTPTSSLDVNGSIRVINNLLVGGDDNTLGSAGTAGQFLISQGAGVPPQWQTVETPIPDTGDWYLLGSLSRTDTRGGLRFTDDQASGPTAYADNYALYPTSITGLWDTSSGSTNTASKPWREFSDFMIDLPAYDETIRLVINLQVLVQAYWDPNSFDKVYRSYAIGLFSDNLLNGSNQKLTMVGSRQGGCIGSGTSNSPQQLMTIVLAVDFPPNSPSRLRILGTQRNKSLTLSTGYLTIGQNLDNLPTDETLLRRATMRADIYKKVTR